MEENNKVYHPPQAPLGTKILKTTTPQLNKDSPKVLSKPNSTTTSTK